MVGIVDKLLMKKIKKREKRKLMLMNQRNDGVSEDIAEAEDDTATEVNKRPRESDENAVPKKKKKKVKQALKEESESENSGSKAEEGIDSQNEAENNTATEVNRRLCESNEKAVPKKKKKKVKQAVKEESESENSGTKAEEVNDSQNEAENNTATEVNRRSCESNENAVPKKKKKNVKRRLKEENESENSGSKAEEGSDSQIEAENNTATELNKRLYESNENALPKKKKKKVKRGVKEENESENSGSKAEEGSDSQNEAENNTATELNKRPRESNENALPKKKKKKVKQAVKEESESENSGSKAEEVNVSQNEAEVTPNTNKQIELPCHSEFPDIFPVHKFADLEGKICDSLYRVIKEMGFTTTTEIQAKTIPLLLKTRHLFGVSKTGSGKTLAFLIPLINFINMVKFKPWNGTGAIILTPTRELAIQTFGVLNELMKYNRQTYGLVMGGANKKKEADKLFYGINILVATPGRLLDHLQNTPDFIYKNICCLVIDEADKMMDMGFEDELRQIIKLMPPYRQTVLFSATQNKKTEALQSFAYHPFKRYLYIGVDDNKETATVDSLVQGFLLCPSENRMQALFTFLRKSRSKKIMVFFSTCKSVEYHYKLFNYIDLSVMALHGKQEQKERTRTFFQFCNAESGVLLCTDVAARGLDIPAVDWIVQYDPPDDAKDYIHRVGRTARGLGTSGQAVMFLRREEWDFLKILKQAKVILNEYGLNWDRVGNFQEQLEILIKRNKYLNQLGKEAFQTFLRAYDQHHLKTIFNVDTLDVAKVAKSFGFTNPPALENHAHNNKGPHQKRNGGGGYGRNKSWNAPTNNYRQRGNDRKSEG